MLLLDHLTTVFQSFLLSFRLVYRCYPLLGIALLADVRVLSQIKEEASQRSSATTLVRAVVHMSSRSSPSPLRYISYCLNCPSPDKGGSVIMGILPKFGSHSFAVTGDLIYAVPNHVESAIINNSHHLFNKIVLVDRGKVSFYEKILRIQQQTAAVGVIIADDGDCDNSLRYCSNSRTGSVKDGGFSAFDDPVLWENINLPVLLVSAESADRLRSVMKVEKVYIAGLGYQNISKASIQEEDMRSRQSFEDSSKEVKKPQDDSAFYSAPPPLDFRIRYDGELSPGFVSSPEVTPMNEHDLQYLEDLREIDDYHNELHGDFDEL
jgi:hypothetical protein